MTSFALRTDQLTKTYGHGRNRTQALAGLNLNVPEGSIYGLLGRNSAGKTTTIRMAVGLARPTSGHVEVFGLNPSRDPERVRVLEQVGYVPESKELVGLTPRRLLEVNRSYYPHTWSDALARKVVDRLELPIDKVWTKLSLGNKTKAALAAAMAQRSRMLILDEPTTGLDPIALDELLRLLVEDCTADGRTVLLSSHQLNEIEQIADHIGIMDRGSLLLEGPLDDVRSRFRRATVMGTALPVHGSSVLSARIDAQSGATSYTLQDEPDAFLAALTASGARVIDSGPMSLNEIFLEICRKHEATEQHSSDATRDEAAS